MSIHGIAISPAAAGPLPRRRAAGGARSNPAGRITGHPGPGRLPEAVALFVPVVDALAATFGPSCEVVLHDLANPAHSVVHIVNGHVSGRQVGDPATDLALRTLEQAGGAPYLANYASVTTDGRELKSTSVMIRDRTGHTVGMLCINLD